jgi:hypothetical protein
MIQKQISINEGIVICIYIILHYLGIVTTYNTVVTTGDNSTRQIAEPTESVSTSNPWDMITFTISNLVENMNFCKHVGGRMFLWYMVYFIVLVLFASTDDGFALQKSNTEYVKIVFYIATIGFSASAFLALIMYVNTKEEKQIVFFKRFYMFISTALFLVLFIYTISKITSKDDIEEKVVDDSVPVVPVVPAVAALPSIVKQRASEIPKMNQYRSVERATRSETPGLLSVNSTQIQGYKL